MPDRPHAAPGSIVLLLLLAASPLCEAQPPAARDIGAQHVVTRAPLRPFVEGGEGERRRADLRARRAGSRLFTPRGVVVAPRG